MNAFRSSILLSVLALASVLPALAQDSPLIERQISNLDVTGNRDVFFDLDSGVETDSTSGDWDIWFNGSRIKVRGSFATLERKFSSVYSAPGSGFISDSSGVTAFPGGSDAGWFMYDSNTHTVEPVPQRTFVLQNADGNYAKFEIISYYKDAVAADTPGAEPRYYTFRYALRTDGEKSLR